MKNLHFIKTEIYNHEKIKRNANKNKLLYLFIISILLSFSSAAQEIWSLEKCIDYGLSNNLDLSVSINKVKRQKVNVLESKAKLLPTLNMGSGLNINFGRNIDGNTNSVTFDQTLSNSYHISSSIDLFQGFIKINTIAFNKYLLSAEKAELSYIENKLIFDIFSSYCVALYSKWLLEVAQSQLTLSEFQYKRMQKIVDIGREPQIIVQELKSQWASDKFNLIIAKNNYNKTLLKLQQLLRFDANKSFTIDSIVLNSNFSSSQQNIDSLFTTAVHVLPEIKQQEFLYKASLKELAVAKGGISPRIYLSSGFYTNYFDGDPVGFTRQIDNNQSQAIIIGINIPIFNKAREYSNIKRKQINVKDRELILLQQKDILYSEIWNAANDFESAKNEYYSAIELFDFSELSLKNVSSKLEKGLASTSDFELAKQRYIDANAGLLKAKIVYYMRKQMLLFYETGNWNHIK